MIDFIVWKQFSQIIKILFSTGGSWTMNKAELYGIWAILQTTQL